MKRSYNTRELCFDINQRGSVGETLLHLCLLNGTLFHIELAKRLVRFYPKMVNDIYISDEFYGTQTNLYVIFANAKVVHNSSFFKYKYRSFFSFFCSRISKSRSK